MATVVFKIHCRLFTTNVTTILDKRDYVFTSDGVSEFDVVRSRFLISETVQVVDSLRCWIGIHFEHHIKFDIGHLDIPLRAIFRWLQLV